MILHEDQRLAKPKKFGGIDSPTKDKPWMRHLVEVIIAGVVSLGDSRENLDDILPS